MAELQLQRTPQASIDFLMLAYQHRQLLEARHPGTTRDDEILEKQVADELDKLGNRIDLCCGILAELTLDQLKEMKANLQAQA